MPVAADLLPAIARTSTFVNAQIIRGAVPEQCEHSGQTSKVSVDGYGCSDDADQISKLGEHRRLCGQELSLFSRKNVSIDYKIITNLSEATKLSTEWNKLIELCSNSSIYDTPEYVLTAWKHYGKKDKKEYLEQK